MTSEPTLSPKTKPGPDIPWHAAGRSEAWTGEIRVNLIRLIAIGGFYFHHLFNYYVQKVDLGPQYHLIVTGIAVAWMAAAMVLHTGLIRRWNPPFLRYASLAFDALLITTLLVFSEGPKSPLLGLLFVLVATAPLRLDLRLVWVASILAILSYGFVCGHSRWVRPEWRVPVRHHVIFVLALAGAGALAGQSVRQARRLAKDYAGRLNAISGGDEPKLESEKGGAL